TAFAAHAVFFVDPDRAVNVTDAGALAPLNFALSVTAAVPIRAFSAGTTHVPASGGGVGEGDGDGLGAGVAKDGVLSGAGVRADPPPHPPAATIATSATAQMRFVWRIVQPPFEIA
ncbi:MAG TPA: hypothetical protein VKA85_02300, partial [Candidatus Limnocylindrales bacterium]|nr:hypothetical protein [Candidatus Limnocylindrales bacterium]